MKRSNFIHKCGPYKVQSISQFPGGVRLEVFPAFPQYGDWAIGREKGEGGGPSIFTAMGLAKEFENFLNQDYTPETVGQWKETLKIALAELKVALLGAKAKG